MSFLDIKALSAALGGKPVLHDVNISVDRGTFIGLIGPNGAGKSTLLKAVLGLIPSHGEVSAAGRDLRQLSARERAQLVSYIPQEREIAWSLKAESVVWLGRTPYRSHLTPPGARDMEAVEQAMRQADIVHLRDRYVSEMSGGERARVLIARALAQDVPLLLADEPTAGLDPAHQIALMEIFAALSANGQTVVVTLHELHLAAGWCDRLLLLDQGTLRADGPPADVLTEEMLDQVYRVRAHFSTRDSRPVIMPISRVRDRNRPSEIAGE